MVGGTTSLAAFSMKRNTMSRGNKIRMTLLVALLLALSYGLAFLGPLSWLIPVALGYGLVVVIRERAWALLVLLVVANPFAVFSVNGARDYVAGAPSLRSMGLPGTEFSNVDPETRCFTHTGGCLVQGDEWVFILPHNLTLRVLCAAFGPPARSYDGPYPDKHEALWLVSKSPHLDGADFMEGKIRTNGQLLQLDRELMDHLRLDLLSFYIDSAYLGNEDIGTHVQAFLLGNRCLIVRLKNYDNTSLPEDPPQDECIILFDTKNMRPFAYYPITRNPLPRSPRVHYLAERSR